MSGLEANFKLYEHHTEEELKEAPDLARSFHSRPTKDWPHKPASVVKGRGMSKGGG